MMKKSLFMILLAICMVCEIVSMPVAAAEIKKPLKPQSDICVPEIVDLVRNYRKEMDIPQEPSKAVYPRKEIEAKKKAEAEKRRKAEEAKKKKAKKVHMGKFRVTYYCACYSCSEGYGNMTATGVRAKEGRTIAVDPKVIPYKTKVEINGHTYIAEDCGGAIKGKDIDIYLESHKRVYQSGVDYYDVYVLRE